MITLRYESPRGVRSLVLESPYRPGFPNRARAIHGFWDKVRRAWLFPPGSETEITRLCQEIYGEAPIWEDEVVPFTAPAETLIKVFRALDPDEQRRVLDAIHTCPPPTAAAAAVTAGVAAAQNGYRELRDRPVPVQVVNAHQRAVVRGVQERATEVKRAESGDTWDSVTAFFGLDTTK